MERNLTEAQREKVAALLRERNLAAAENIHSAAREHSPSFYERRVKRAADIVFSGAALVLTLPINAAIAVGTYIDVGRPIFFTQQRTGKNGRLFTLVKFRNMTNDCDEDGNLLPPDRRVTSFGRIMRTTSLDELLNFWSIFKGDMSMIGPRPLLPEYMDRYCGYHRSRLSVKPGLECPPQPDLDDGTSWEGQFNSDVWYAEHVSLITDVKKFWRLIEAVFNRRSTLVRGSAGRSWFMGYDENGRAIGLAEVSQEIIDEALAEEK